jgi:hypothetical protein
MTDKKQIEEMAKDLYGEIDYDVNCYSDDNYSEVNFDYRETAKNIVEKGWIKPSEDSVVLSREEFVEFEKKKEDLLCKEYKLMNYEKEIKDQARKETAEKSINIVDTVCKEHNCLALAIVIKNRLIKELGVEIKE